MCDSLQKTKEPLPGQDVNAIWESCKDDGVLLGKGGLYGSVSFYEACYYISASVSPYYHVSCVHGG